MTQLAHGRIESAATIRGWHQRPAKIASDSQVNALTIDVEDYFQVEAFADVIDRATWDSFESRIERNVNVILDLLSSSSTKATFFTLSWIAKRYGPLVRRIVSEGHELASHGTDHCRVDVQSRQDLLFDLRDSKKVLEDIGGCEVKGFRAPSFSIGHENLWALESIAHAGYRYSSSIYPVHHDNYGIPTAPRFAFHPFSGLNFVEIPVSAVRVGSRNWPCGGGGYFRLLPYQLNRAALTHVRQMDGLPCVFYFHPWELDVLQPRIQQARLKSRFRHYLKLKSMLPKLTQLLQHFSWCRMDEIFLCETETL